LGGLIGSGVTAAEGVETAEVPAELVAVTVNVTRCPFASDGTIAQWLGSFAVIVWPVEAATVNDVTGAPSTVAGACQRTVADPEPASAVTWVGVSGASLAPKAPAGAQAKMAAQVSKAAMYVIHRFMWASWAPLST
jgi:hypothetical protein